MKVFANGLLTGLFLQLAVGPVFFYIVNLTIQKSFFDGLAGVLAVTTVDYLYILFAVFGVGKLLEKKKVKKAFGIASSIVLMIFGLVIIRSVLGGNVSTFTGTNPLNFTTSFISVFFLTISSPMTIVFFTGIFSAKAIENNYTKKELLIFGLSVGLSTLLFMSASVVLFSLLGGSIPIKIIQTLNILVGLLLIVYGTIRIRPVLQNRF
jgi:threonine/homoserine/homoserine lactone efflux protein